MPVRKNHCSQSSGYVGHIHRSTGDSVDRLDDRGWGDLTVLVRDNSLADTVNASPSYSSTPQILSITSETEPVTTITTSLVSMERWKVSGKKRGHTLLLPRRLLDLAFRIFPVGLWKNILLYKQSIPKQESSLNTNNIKIEFDASVHLAKAKAMLIKHHPWDLGG